MPIRCVTRRDSARTSALDGLNKLTLLKETDVCQSPIDALEVAIDTSLLLT